MNFFAHFDKQVTLYKQFRLYRHTGGISGVYMPVAGKSAGGKDGARMKRVRIACAAALCAAVIWGLVSAWGEIRWKNTPVFLPSLPSFSTSADENGQNVPVRTVSAPVAVSPAPSVSASAACVMTGSGILLYELGGTSFLPIASTTKIMTALLTLELGKGQLDKEFTVGDEVKVEGSALGIKPGATVTLRLLAWGMLLSSGNDAASAAAVRLGGSFEGFAELMNQKARELGLENTVYVTPSGLDADGQGSCAKDLATLACAALQNEDFRAICSQTNGHMEIGGVPYWMTNHNRLLKEYDGCIGVKTGFTDSAGRCLVSAAERGGETIIAVVLHDPNDWADSAALLDWGFAQLTKTALEADLTGVRIPVRAAIDPETGEESTPGSVSIRQRTPVTVSLAPGEVLREEMELVCSLPADASPGDAAGMVKWVDGDGMVRGWSILEVE